MNNLSYPGKHIDKALDTDFDSLLEKIRCD